jgi:transcriptional regulator with XRE-family HTH domain
MGYRGKTLEQEEARELRAAGLTLVEIATKLGVAKSSVSLWVRDVPVPPRPRGRQWSPDRKPSSLTVAKQAEIERLLAERRERIGRLSEREFLVAGAALYARRGRQA